MNDQLNKEEMEKTINETVEQMKAKIDEITKQASKVEGEYSDKARELSDKAVDVLKQASDKLEEAWAAVTDPDEIKKAVDFVTVKSKEVYEASMKKINEFINSESVKKAADDTEKFFKDASNKAGQALKDAYEKAMENPDVKELADGVSKAYSNAKKNVNEFLEKPEIKEGIDKAKDVTVDYAEKAVAALKEWLKPDTKKDEDNQ